VRNFNIFVIRAIIGAGSAILLARMFRPGYGPVHIAGLAVLLVGLAYFLEYRQNRKKSE